MYILLFSLLLIRTFECQITSSITLTYLIYYFTDLAKTIYRYNNRDILPLLYLPCQLSLCMGWNCMERPEKTRDFRQSVELFSHDFEARIEPAILEMKALLITMRLNSILIFTDFQWKRSRWCSQRPSAVHRWASYGYTGRKIPSWTSKEAER